MDSSSPGVGIERADHTQRRQYRSQVLDDQATASSKDWERGFGRVIVEDNESSRYGGTSGTSDPAPEEHAIISSGPFACRSFDSGGDAGPFPSHRRRPLASSEMALVATRPVTRGTGGRITEAHEVAVRINGPVRRAGLSDCPRHCRLQWSASQQAETSREDSTDDSTFDEDDTYHSEELAGSSEAIALRHDTAGMAHLFMIALDAGSVTSYRYWAACFLRSPTKAWW
jgi:hypothetical protein